MPEPIVVGLIMFVVGVLVGSFVTWRVLKEE